MMRQILEFFCIPFDLVTIGSYVASKSVDFSIPFDLITIGSIVIAVSAKLSKPTGQKISKVRKQQKKIQFCQSYSYVNRNVWYHQI